MMSKSSELFPESNEDSNILPFEEPTEFDEEILGKLRSMHNKNGFDNQVLALREPPPYLDGPFSDRLDFDDDDEPIFPDEVDNQLDAGGCGWPSFTEEEYNRRVEEIKQKRREAKQKANS